MEPCCDHCGHFLSSHISSGSCRNCTCGKFTSIMKSSDPVTHPDHYNHGKYEVIDVLADWELDFCDGNTVKYIARAGKKDPTKQLEDLEKARFYLDYKIGEILGGERWHPQHRNSSDESESDPNPENLNVGDHVAYYPAEHVGYNGVIVAIKGDSANVKWDDSLRPPLWILLTNLRKINAN